MNRIEGVRRRSLLMLAAGLALAVGMLVLTACSGGGGGGTQMELRDFEFRPNQLSAKTGEAVSLSFKNTGTQLHDFNVDDLGVHSPVISPGQSGSFSFTPSRAGTYQFICNQPGHKEAGMVGTLTVS